MSAASPCYTPAIARSRHYFVLIGTALLALCSSCAPVQAFDIGWPQWPFGKKSAPRRVWTPKRGPVFNFKALTATPLNPNVLKRTVRDGIVTEEVMFHSETDGRKTVDIFAYFSYPRGGRNLPAFIWIEGGLAPARTFLTQFGARRGYATLAIDFPQPGYRSTGNYPINLMMTVDENPRQSPIYHGAVALLKAVSFWNRARRSTKNASAWRAVRGAVFYDADGGHRPTTQGRHVHVRQRQFAKRQHVVGCLRSQRALRSGSSRALAQDS